MEELDLKELLSYFVSKIYIVVISIIVCVLAGNIYLKATTNPLYRSETSLVMVNKNEDTGVTQNDLNLNDRLVATYNEIVKSRRVLSQVITNLGLNISEEAIAGRVTVSTVTGTQLIRISVSDESPEKAKRIADEVASVFSKEIEKIYKVENLSVVDTANLPSSPYNVKTSSSMYFRGG